LCGFAGLFKNTALTENDVERLDKMSLSIRYRGPDDSNKLVLDNIGLAFRRLSIIDLENGNQPFSIDNGSVFGVFNGEIYNYKILREELIADGVTFSTNSEIEVMLNLYKKYGPPFVEKLRGMFAIAFFNTYEKELVIARDPFGIKPLYYNESDASLVFASETKPFIFDENFGGFSVDEKLLQQYLTYQYVPEPKTLAGPTVLPAGSYAVKKIGSPLSIHTYFEPVFKPNRSLSFEKKSQELREVLTDSVKKHLISDVPVGTFLSSGIDSAVITAIASKINPGIKAFTVAFGEKEYSEIKDAEAIAKHLDIEHITLSANIEDFKNSFESVVWHLDSPVADPSTMAIFLICKEASKHLKVVLSGEGADELFGGYRIYKEQIYSSKIFALPGFLKSFLAYLGRILPENVKGRAFLIRGTTPLDKRYVGNAFVFNEEQKKPILRNYDENIHFSDIVKPVYDRAKELSLTPMLQMQYVDMNTWIRGDILTKGDRLSMAHSLEVRVPFLDKEVFKFASTLTDKDKLSHKTTKYILRYTFKDLVDEATFMRPKWGYPVPVRKWLKNELYPWAKDIIENSTADDYIVKEEALKLLEAHRDGTADNYRKLWVILVFITWYRLYVTDINNSIKKYITD